VKIVRVIARLNIGGPARHVTLIADGLHAHGYDTLLVHGEPGPAEGSFDDLVSGATRRIKLGSLGRDVRPWSDARTLIEMTRIIFRERPDVVHTHTAKAGMIGRLATAIFNATRPRAARALIVHTFHGNVLEGYFRPSVERMVRVTERLLASLSDCIIAISPQQRAELVDRFHIAPPRKVHVIRLGLDLEALLAMNADMPSLRKELGWNECDVVFGYVGRLVPIKDLALLLRAFAKVAASITSARLVVAGDGTERDALERLTKDIGIGDRVAFVGWQRDLSCLYRTFDVVVLSSQNEGTPVALIEAMAAKLPVAAPAVGGVADVVVNGRTGLLVEPRNDEQLARTMIELARDPDARRRMGAEGRTIAAKLYNLDRLVSELDQLYREGLQIKRRELVGALPPSAADDAM
jgi:glycosyltransferase involved in cell wall biosynthesis